MEEAALALQCMRLEVPGEHQVPCEAEDADGELAGEWEEEDDTYEHLPLSPGADVSLSSVRTDWPGTSTPEAPCVGASREAGRLPVVLARCYSSVVGLVNTRLRPLQGHVQFYERCS